VVDVGLAADARGCAGGGFVQLEEGAAHAHARRSFVQDAQLPVAGMQLEAVVLLGDRAALDGRSGHGARLLFLARLPQLAFERLLNQFVLDAGGQARQSFLCLAHGAQWIIRCFGAPASSSLANFAMSSLGTSSVCCETTCSTCASSVSCAGVSPSLRSSWISLPASLASVGLSLSAMTGRRMPKRFSRATTSSTPIRES